jgi:hypothetical protein
MQVAYDETIWIFYLFRYKAPNNLHLFINSRNIIKVGRNVKNDLSKIRTDYALPQPGSDINNVVELGSYLKSRRLVESGRDGLQAIVAQVLRRHLPKPQDVRCSNWDKELSQEQTQYAALDAFASLRVFQVSQRTAESMARLESATCGLLVCYMEGSTQIFTGEIISRIPSRRDRVWVKITARLLPGAKIFEKANVDNEVEVLVRKLFEDHNSVRWVGEFQFPSHKSSLKSKFR